MQQSVVIPQIIENPVTPADREHNFKVSSMKIVGAVYVKNPGPWWIPPGLEDTHDAPSHYRPVFFGGTREYTNDEEGWIEVNNSKRSERRRHRKQKRYDDIIQQYLIADNQSVNE